MSQKSAIVLFCVLLGLPLLLFALGIRGASIDNRTPRDIAPLSVSGIRSGKWFASVNDYLIDHTPLRGHAVAANAWIDWHVFGESGNPSVSRGQDGWLFLNNSLDHACVTTQEINRRFTHLMETATHYQTQHKTRIVWVIAPNKESIYPEMLTPLQTARSRCATANRKAMRTLLGQPKFAGTIIGLWDALEPHKTGQLYRKADSHWNFGGASLAMTEMLERIWPNIYHEGDLNPAEEIDYQGDLGKMLGLANLREKETLWKATREGVKLEDKQPVCMKDATARRRSFRHSSTAAPLVPEKVVILRDSFFDAPLHFMPPFFAQVDIGHIDHTPKEDWPQIAACADTLVIESVERSILGRAEEFYRIMQIAE
jgi:hypothetical protein